MSQPVVIEDLPASKQLYAWFGSFDEIMKKRVYALDNAPARMLALTMLNQIKTRKIHHRVYNQNKGNPVVPITFVNVPNEVCEVMRLLDETSLTSEEAQKLKRKSPREIIQWLTIRKVVNAPMFKQRRNPSKEEKLR